MNMHLHLHLAECIVDYGPVYAFWCFAFERMNGVLGSYHTNNQYSLQTVSLIAEYIFQLIGQLNFLRNTILLLEPSCITRVLLCRKQLKQRFF